MGDSPLNIDETLNKDDLKQYVLLLKDYKLICRTQCLNAPPEVPPNWDLHEIVRRKKIHVDHDLPHCILCPSPENDRDRKEWRIFLDFLHTKDMVALSKFKSYQFYILPPEEASNYSCLKVAYRMLKDCSSYDGQRHCKAVLDASVDTKSRLESPFGTVKEHAHRDDACTSEHRFSRVIGDCHTRNVPLEKNYVRADPSYLKTLGQAHSGWIFGAIAELVDNSWDAKSTKLEIFIDIIYSKRDSKDIPILSVIDDGHGMSHEEVVRMTCFGHKQPDADNPDHVGRFGVGFKTGAMRLGGDALVLTQTTNSRSIAFLSQALNEGKDNLEIPIVSYCRQGQFMEVDKSVQSEALAKYNLKAIKEFSPFDKYLIGEKVGFFRGKNTGTQIYIWNLDRWGSDYCLEWHNGLNGGSSFHYGDILIRSRRIRSRSGQMSQKVPLDYSLRSYLEVIFLVPRMKIFVQGSLVKSRPLEKSLNKTVVESFNIMGKRVQLTLGRSQLEWEQANCGIFLYWHGRIIEAYKRVGCMIHNGDICRGVIGVVDVTDLMDDGNGRVWVHSNKQGFLDCEQYARLEEWLGSIVDEYFDKNLDTLQLQKGSALYKPDHEWVQCDKCRKWRMLSSAFDSKNLPLEWFCYMNPFNGSCETPEQKVERGVITVSAKRSGYDGIEKPARCKEVTDIDVTTEGEGKEKLDQTVEEGLNKPVIKRSRRRLVRACRKG